MDVEQADIELMLEIGTKNKVNFEQFLQCLNANDFG